MDVKLNHSDLSALLAKESECSVAKAELFTKAFFDLIIEGLESDGSVKINGLGTFKITDVASRSSVNVNTGEKFEIKGHKKLSFIPADSLKDNVNLPFAMFEPVEVDDTYTDDEPAEVDETEENRNGQPEENVEEFATVIEEEPSKTITANVIAGTDTVEEKPAEEPVLVQTRPTEPVMVRVPKKEKKIQVVKKNKKSNKWQYIMLPVFILFLAAVFCFCYFFTAPVKEESVYAKTEETLVISDAKAETGHLAIDSAVAVAEMAPQNQEMNSEEHIVSEIVQFDENKEPYEFVMIEELRSLSLNNITLADTNLYDITGEWAEHKVIAGETLTRIALKYYGDKRLWPYIVKHNSMSRPDDLRKGMLISIPKLKPIN